MNFEHATEYGPHIPDKELVLKVFSEFGEDTDESKTAIRLWIDEKHRLANLNEERINRLLVDFEIGILFAEAGFIDLAINYYDDIFDLLECDQSLTERETIILRQKVDELGNVIDKQS